MCVSSETLFFVCCIFRQKSKKIDAKVSKKMFLEIAPECWLKVLFPEKNMFSRTKHVLDSKMCKKSLGQCSGEFSKKHVVHFVTCLKS